MNSATQIIERSQSSISQTHLSVVATQPELEREAYPGELAFLRKQSSRLTHLVDELPSGVVMVDYSGVITSSNQAAVDMLGEPLVGEYWFDIIQRSFDPKEDDGHEVSLVDGRRVKLSICPLEDHMGQLIVVTDLTETRLLQERISHMQRLSALGKMVASLAHQVRTPLSAALLYASNLGRANLPAVSKQKFHSKLMSRLDDIGQQVNNMLLFARSGGNEVVETISLQQLLTEVRLGADAMISQQPVDVQVSLPDPDVLIQGNKSALASAIQNLIHNSLQAITETESNSGLVRIAAFCDERDKETVIIRVEDNGSGMDERVRERVFEPFFTTKSHGTGLGLSVVKAVTHAHQGVLSVEDSSLTTDETGVQINMRLPIKPHTDESSATQQ
jgi:two-component system sensor histidine kinase FlrB